ncbi:MAG: SulP family inorganic anion transporter [Gaiellales bacterium]
MRTVLATISRRTFPTRADFPQSGSDWLADLIAGVTVGVVALPLAMGFGIASGVGATPGIITAIVAGFVAAVFGGSNLQVSGPTGAMTVVLLPAVADHGVTAVPTLAVLAGIMVVLGGWLGLGRAVTFIPWPVIEGFTFGIATIIFLQQVPLLVDVTLPPGDHNTLVATTRVLQHATWDVAWPLVVVGGGVMVMMAIIRRVRPRFPGSLIAIVIATVACWALNIDAPTIGQLALSDLVQVPRMPGLGEVGELMPAAVIIALLAALESLLSARVADGMSDVTPTDPDRELVGQGLANIASGLVGGLPATGAIARTAVNARAGARTRMASAFHGIALLVLLVGASRVIAYVPLAALAGVLMMTAINMVERATIRALLRHAGRSTALVFLLTAGTTILFDLARAVQVGILAAAILVLRTAAKQSGIEEEAIPPNPNHLDDKEFRELLDDRVVVYRLQGSLFFGAAQHFLEELTSLDQARVIVLRLGALHVIDVTGAQVLAETIDDFRQRGIVVLLCRILPRHERMLAAVGIPGSRIDRQLLFTDLSQAVEVARQIAADSDPD